MSALNSSVLGPFNLNRRLNCVRSDTNRLFVHTYYSEEILL